VRWSVGWRGPDSNRTRPSASLGSSRTSSNASSQCCQTRSYRPRHAGREGDEQERRCRPPVRILVAPGGSGQLAAAAACVLGTTPRRPGLAAREGRDWHITRPFRRIDTCAIRNARRGVRSWRCCVTDRCPPARVDMQCRLPLLVEGVALAGDQAWLSPEPMAIGESNFDAAFRGRRWPMTTIWVARRGEVSRTRSLRGRRCACPRGYESLSFARRSISFASEAGRVSQLL
jgi:hypothetical protein